MLCASITQYQRLFGWSLQTGICVLDDVKFLYSCHLHSCEWINLTDLQNTQICIKMSVWSQQFTGLITNSTVLIHSVTLLVPQIVSCHLDNGKFFGSYRPYSCKWSNLTDRIFKILSNWCLISTLCRNYHALPTILIPLTYWVGRRSLSVFRYVFIIFPICAITGAKTARFSAVLPIS